MRTALIVCAAMASLAVSPALWAQNCGPACQNCDDVCTCLAGNSCAGNGNCGQNDCEQGVCQAAGCNENGCPADACNAYDTNPYTYYQLRDDWRKEWKHCNNPVARGVKYLHSTCPKKNHCHHNGNNAAYVRAQTTPWHGDYYYPQWGGAPVALVVPPTAEFQTNYSWGVPSSRIGTIDSQFSRRYPGYGAGPGGGGVVGSTGFLPPPLQPNDTNQFGVYYVRGPW